MMSIDEILTSGALVQWREKIQELADVRNWKKEDRDSKFKGIEDVCKDITGISVDFTNTILNSPIYPDGPSYLESQITLQFRCAELDLLMRMRNELDYVDDQELTELPIDYDWLNALIRVKVLEVAKLEDDIERFSSTFSVVKAGDIEEL